MDNNSDINVIPSLNNTDNNASSLPSSSIKSTASSKSDINQDKINEKINNNAKDTNTKLMIQKFIEEIPQAYLILCIFILFIIFFILIVIILVCLLKKRKNELKNSKMVANNNLNMNQIVIKNPPFNHKNKIEDFHSVPNTSKVIDNTPAQNNVLVNEIKGKNLKEEIHSIISGTLSGLAENKLKRTKKRRKGNTTSSRTEGKQLSQCENNNENNSNDNNINNINNI